MTLFIGDVHGKFAQYKRLIRDTRDTIQVGDLGVGFRKWPHGESSTNPPYDLMVEGNHKFIRGNHDNPTVCRNHSQHLGDVLVTPEMMSVAGALSIDKQWRMPEYSWWEGEEQSIAELNAATDLFVNAKPRVMVTHDCPEEIAQLIMGTIPIIKGLNKTDFPSRTRQALQSMWSAHSPDLWVFGHWHVSRDFVANGTRFVCLAELEMRGL